MVKLILLVVLFISICIPLISYGQEPIDSTKKFSDYRFTELEATFLGVGINRVFEKKKHTIGWALNFYYANWILSSSDTSYKNLKTDSNIDLDFLKLKFLYRKEFLNYFNIEISPFLSASVFAPNETYYLSFGIEPVLYYLKLGRVKFSASLSFEKALTNKYYYLSFNPIRINIRMDNKSNFK